MNRIRFSVVTEDYLAWRARTPKKRPYRRLRELNQARGSSKGVK